MTETPSTSAEGANRSARHELATVLSQVLSATCALLETSEPSTLLGEDAPLARALGRWRRVLAGLHGEEAGLLARGRLAEVENERDALRVRQSELLEQLLTLNHRLQAAKRDLLGLRFEADRARAEARQAERELRELRPRGAAAEPPAAAAAPVDPLAVPASEPEPPSSTVEDALREELELARTRSEQRGHDARAALDALFAPRPGPEAPATPVRKSRQSPPAKKTPPTRRKKQAPPTPSKNQAPPTPSKKTPPPKQAPSRKKQSGKQPAARAPAASKTSRGQRRVPTTRTTPPQRRRP